MQENSLDGFLNDLSKLRELLACMQTYVDRSEGKLTPQRIEWIYELLDHVELEILSIEMELDAFHEYQEYSVTPPNTPTATPTPPPSPASPISPLLGATTFSSTRLCKC